MELRPTHELIEPFERCNRLGIFNRDWIRNKISPAQMLAVGIREGLVSQRPDFNQAAGEKVFELASTHQIDSKQLDLHSEVVHLCSIVDVVSLALRKKGPWSPVEPIEMGNGHVWRSDAFLDDSGDYLRRVLCISSPWSDERHYSLCHGWPTLGTISANELPMKIGVVLLGQHRDGRYHSPWSKAVMHPANKKLRFRKKTEGKFKESWLPIWREDRDEIDTSTWMDAMFADGVLQDSLILIDVPVPESKVRNDILKLAQRKLTTIYGTKTLPDKNLSTCFFPTRCPFAGPCLTDQEPSGRFGLVRINEIG